MAWNRLTEEGLLFIEQTLRHLLPGISDFDFNKNYWKPSRQAIKRACDRSKASKNWLQLWPLLYAALITIPLLAMYLENSASYSDILWLMKVRLNMRWLEGDCTLPSFKADWRFPTTYITRHGKLAAQARDITARENKTVQNLPVQSVRTVNYFISSLN